MSYYEMLCGQVPQVLEDITPNQTQPHMSLTPKEILEKFTTQGVTMSENVPTDDIVDSFSDEDFDNNEVDPDDVVFSEDKFDLYENTLKQAKMVRSKKSKKNENDNSNSGNRNDSDDVKSEPVSDPAPEGIQK